MSQLAINWTFVLNSPGLPLPDTMARAALTAQFFPNVKAPDDEFPPIFSSASFSLNAAEHLAQTDIKTPRDYVRLRARRFDGLVRRLGLPHPLTYSRLVLHLRSNWTSLAQHLDSPESLIKPTCLAPDGKILTMNYGEGNTRAFRETRAAQGHAYLVEADMGTVRLTV